MKIERTPQDAAQDILEGYEIITLKEITIEGATFYQKGSVSPAIIRSIIENYLEDLSAELYVDGELTSDSIDVDAEEGDVDDSEDVSDNSVKEDTETLQEAVSEPEKKPLPEHEPVLAGFTLSQIKGMYVNQGMSSIKIAEYLNLGIEGRKRVQNFLTKNHITRKGVTVNVEDSESNASASE